MVVEVDVLVVLLVLLILLDEVLLLEEEEEKKECLLNLSRREEEVEVEEELLDLEVKSVKIKEFLVALLLVRVRILLLLNAIFDFCGPVSPFFNFLIFLIFTYLIFFN